MTTSVTFLSLFDYRVGTFTLSVNFAIVPSMIRYLVVHNCRSFFRRMHYGFICLNHNITHLFNYLFTILRAVTLTENHFNMNPNTHLQHDHREH